MVEFLYQMSQFTFIIDQSTLWCVSMINAMKVGEHSNKWAKNLSGGTRRKVEHLWLFM